MKLSVGWLLALSVLASCGATVKVEGGGGSSSGGSSAGGFGSSDDGISDDDGSLDGSGGFSSSDGGSFTGPLAPDCYEESLAYALDPESITGVSVGQGVCTPMQISDILGSCINPDEPDLCEAFAALPENQACFDCTFGGDAPIPMPVVIRGEGDPFLTVYACAAHVMGLPECAVPVQSRIFCAFTTCEQCMRDAEAFNECVNWALNESEVCITIEIPEPCEAVFAIEQIPEECIGNTTTLEEAFPILADFYCGLP